MVGRESKAEGEDSAAPNALKSALREARIEAAERSAVVVDLRDAEVARLELLNEALDPLFKEIPEGIELFDRGVSRGDVPRLWIDVIAHVHMGRDKRAYRFVQDSRIGRRVLAETHDIPAMVTEITRYVARRLIEREQALADDSASRPTDRGRKIRLPRRRSRWRTFRAFLLGLIVGIAALFALALMSPLP